MHNFRELKIWQRAMDVTTSVYEVSKNLPDAERYGLISQMKRAAVSIPTNIAEGAGRDSNREFVRFLKIANGSCFELETQLIISKRLRLLDEQTVQSLLEKLSEIEKMNYKLCSKFAS